MAVNRLAGGPQSSSEDLYTKIALDNKLVTRFQVRQACKEQEDLGAQGTPLDLGNVMVRLGFLTDRQHQSVLNACRYREQRDYDKRFARQTLRMEVLTQEQIERALEQQKVEYGHSGAVTPLADHLVKHGVLSAQQAEGIHKGIQERDRARTQVQRGSKPSRRELAVSGPTPVLPPPATRRQSETEDLDDDLPLDDADLEEPEGDDGLDGDLDDDLDGDDADLDDDLDDADVESDLGDVDDEEAAEDEDLDDLDDADLESDLGDVDLDDVDLDDADLESDLGDVDLDDDDLDGDLDGDLEGDLGDEDLPDDEDLDGLDDADLESALGAAPAAAAPAASDLGDLADLNLDHLDEDELDAGDLGEGEDEDDLAEVASELDSEVHLDAEDLQVLEEMGSEEELEEAAQWAAEAFDPRPLHVRPPSERVPIYDDDSTVAPARPTPPAAPSPPRAPTSARVPAAEARKGGIPGGDVFDEGLSDMAKAEASSEAHAAPVPPAPPPAPPSASRRAPVATDFGAVLDPLDQSDQDDLDVPIPSDRSLGRGRRRVPETVELEPEQRWVDPRDAPSEERRIQIEAAVTSAINKALATDDGHDLPAASQAAGSPAAVTKSAQRDGGIDLRDPRLRRAFERAMEVAWKAFLEELGPELGSGR
ncbi:MAG: hypothetical protein AB7N76_19775 [Planctomycetota bacterium]